MSKEISYAKESEKERKTKKKIKPGRIILLVLLAVVVGYGIFTILGMKNKKGTPGKSDAVTEAQKDTVFAVTTTKAVSGQIKDLLYINGDVVPASSVEVYPDTSGKLTKLNVSLGEYVRKDQVIAEIDPSKPGMSFTENPVKAIVSGTITSLPFDIGATMSPQVPVAKIGNLTNLQVKTYIPEKFISRIEMGMKAVLSFESYPGETFDAVVMELSPVVDEVSRTMMIKMDIVKRDKRIKAGMYAKISLITQEKKNILRIPTDCIISRFGETFVFALEGEDRVSKRLVKEGIRINGVSEIKEGLNPGDTIIFQGQTLLDDQAPVKVVRTVQPLK